jgi:hypothetical protein
MFGKRLHPSIQASSVTELPNKFPSNIPVTEEAAINAQGMLSFF